MVVIARPGASQGALPALAAGWAAGPAPFLDALAEAAAEPVPRLLLAPFRVLVRPLAAHSLESWVRAMGPALGLLLVHYVWVIRSDTAFEEAAAETSLQRARRSAERGARPPTPGPARRRLPRLLRLAPLGRPAGAILWKNLVAVVRTRRARNAALAFVAAGAVAGLLSFGPNGGIAELAGWLATTWAAMALVIGPQWIRNDLRSDLLKLDLLRSYPIPGRAVVAAEAAGSTLVLTALQLGLLLIAYLAFLGNARLELDLETRTCVLVVAILCLPGINFVGMLIQNGAALLFPAWVHLGAGRPGGVEALGQNMLMIVAYSATLAAVLAGPGALAAALFALLRDGLGWWAAVPASAVLLSGLAVEALVALRWLGGVFERTDPAGANLAA